MQTSRIALVGLVAIGVPVALAQDSPYKILRTAKSGGAGGFDYIHADAAGRKLYIPRMGNPGRVSVFNLDTLAPLGEIADVSGHGAVISTKSGHGFASSQPVAMWDTKTMQVVKTIEVQGRPDGILYDGFNNRVYILSHSAPNATVINAADGSILGTIDLGGAPEEAASDGKGTIYVDIEDKGSIAVVDAKDMSVKTHYDLQGKGNGCAGLALDIKNEILFATCRNPQNMVILSARDGKILDTLPIGQGTDGAAFNPKTREAFSSQGDGTLTIVKENSPTSFAVEQTLKTMTGAKTITLDSKTGHLFLMAAEYKPLPPPAGGQAPAEGPGRGRGGRGGRGFFGPGMVPDSFTIIEAGR